MSKEKFDSESEIHVDHLFNFIKKCMSCKVTDDSVKCMIFTLTFKARIKEWLNVLPIESIQSWEQFMELFVFAHQSYNYEKLCDEIESLWREKDESIVDFNSRIPHVHYRPHDDDQPS